MLTIDRLTTPLRALLAALFAILVLLQLMSFPGQFAHMAEVSPEKAHLRWPLTALAFVELLCVQVVVVSTWKLLAMVRADRIFSEGALTWVDWIVRAVGVGWALMFGVFLYVGFRADDPGLPLLMAVMLLAGAVAGLLMVVMRALLLQATTLRTDMDAVI